MTEINSKIAEEAKEAYEREDAKNYYSPESDVLLNFWSYVISHADVPNILAESAFLKNFNFIGYAYGEASYLATTFVTAVETIFRDNVKEDPYKASAAQNILKSEIKTTKVDIMAKKSRDRSQTSAIKRATKLGGA